MTDLKTSLIEEMEAVITPNNVALGHTWLKRQLREIIRNHQPAVGENVVRKVAYAIYASLRIGDHSFDEFNRSEYVDIYKEAAKAAIHALTGREG